MKAIDRRGAEPIEVVYRAPIVISDVGAPLTFERLLPTDGEIGAKTAKLRAFVEGLGGGLSAVNLYLRLKAPVSTLGIQGENYWINADLEHDDVEAHTAQVLAGAPRHAYLSFPSAKSGDDRFHTAEIIAMVVPRPSTPGAAASAAIAAATTTSSRNALRDGLMRLAETAAPGLSALVEYRELSTPLTVEHFTSHPARPLLRPAGAAGAIPVLAARRADARAGPLSRRRRRREPRHHRRDDGRGGGGEPRPRTVGLPAHHGEGRSAQGARGWRGHDPPKSSAPG